MSEKAVQVLERLVQKLSAVRQTLDDDERLILDRMVTSIQPEVVLHSLSPAADPAADPALSPKADPAVTPKLDPAVSPKLDPAMDDEEVTLHAVRPAVDPAVDPALDPKHDDWGWGPGKVAPKVAIDENGSYKIIH